MKKADEKGPMDATSSMDSQMASDKIDWEQRRYEIAKDSLAAMLGNPTLINGVSDEGEPTWDVPAPIASTAVIFADLLIQELKKGEGQES